MVGRAAQPVGVIGSSGGLVIRSTFGGVAWGDEPGFVGEDDGLGAVAEDEFGEDAGDVGLTVASLRVRSRAISVLDSPVR